MKFLDLKTAVRTLIWADGEAENLVAAHDNHFIEAMADIQKWVPQERMVNVDVIPFADTFFKAGMSIVNQPRGRIYRIFTIANDNWGDPVYYKMTERGEPECWGRNLLSYSLPANTGLPPLPLGFRPADKATDGTLGRARAGIFALQDRSVYVAPWLQSNEKLVMVWSGVKNKWADGDIVTDAIDFAKTVRLLVRYYHERDYGMNPQEKAAADMEARNAVADLIWEWKQYTQRHNEPECKDERGRTAAELALSALPTTSPVATPDLSGQVGGEVQGQMALAIALPSTLSISGFPGSFGGVTFCAGVLASGSAAWNGAFPARADNTILVWKLEAQQLLKSVLGNAFYGASVSLVMLNGQYAFQLDIQTMVSANALGAAPALLWRGRKAINIGDGPVGVYTVVPEGCSVLPASLTIATP